MRFRIECELPFARADFWRLRAARGFLDFIVADGLLKKMEASPTEFDADGWATRRQHYCPSHVDCPDFLRTVIGNTMFEVNDDQRWHDELAPFEQKYRITPSFLTGISRTSGTLAVQLHPDYVPGEEIDDDNTSSEPMQDNSASEDGAPSTSGLMDESSSGDGELHVEVSDPDDDLSSAGSATDAEGSDSGDSDFAKEPLDVKDLLSLLPPSDKSIHVVTGETRVSILTLGWFIERSVVHNLRNFYRDYPGTVTRFRQKIYNDFANGDQSVPCHVVVDRFLESEAAIEREAAARRDAQAGLGSKIEQNVDSICDTVPDAGEVVPVCKA